MLAPITELTELLAQLTETPKPVARQNVRAQRDRGVGPTRMEPLSDSVLADLLLGFLSLTHIGAADLAQQFGQFKLGDSGMSAIRGPSGAASDLVKSSAKALEKLLPPLRTSSL